MKDKKKVLLLGPAHPFRGGIADTQNYLAQNLNALGHEVTVFTFTTQYPKLLFPGKTQFSDEKAPDQINIKMKIHSFNPFNWSKVAQSINQINPDYVIFRYWTPFLAPCWYGIAREIHKTIKKIGLVDNWIPHEPKFWDKTLTQLFSSQMDGFASLSTAVGDQILSNKHQLPVWKGFHPISDHLPQTIPQKKAREALGWPQDKKIVLFFGLIRKYKGLDMLIEAFSKTPLNRLDVILAIVGEAYEPQLKYTELIRKLNLEERIICDFNYANSQKARQVFCAADVIALTYTSATQSGVTSLAYHFKIPLLVSDLAGLRTPILEDQTGMITEIKAEKIAVNLNKILSDNNLSEFQLSFQKVGDKYSWKSFGLSLMNFMGQL
ncbi:glycosyltransferase [Flavobacteriaceae bacterium]|jgi:glycosyltransferase involved in cell wall biosynthesis|nr:glycosyltransferase [Flavobacteriaceae bacterium]